MTIYTDILLWAENKDPWIQDALRQIITQVEINDENIDRLFSLLKKETGFGNIKIEPRPLTEKDIPSEISNLDSIISLNSIENPQNINALYSESLLTFNEIGLNIIYGDNGTGKSGYARILKKVCWSRDRNFILKKDIFTDNEEEQKVTIKYSDQNYIYTFNWEEDSTIPKELNSINVFDINCSNLYINSENPTEYKPIGLDVLERLIEVFIKISKKIDNEIIQLKTEKPFLDEKYKGTKIFGWYADIENKEREELKKTIVFTEQNKNRLIELTTLLSKSNPEKENIDLTQKSKRYSIVFKKLEEVEKSLNNESIKNYNTLLKEYKIKKDAYIIAAKKYKGDEPLDGVGSETWRQLWESAREYAITEVHPEVEDFPADLSEEYCVFCQQPLGDEAKDRIKRFDLFISDKTSSQFEKFKNKRNELFQNISNISVEIDNNIDEIDSEIKGFKNKVTQFKKDSDNILSSFASILSTEKEIGENQKFEQVSKLVKERIDEIEKTIQANLDLIAERKRLISEHYELSALNDLYKQRERISKYYEEDLTKYWLNKAKAKTNTRIISQKIGEIQEDKAINEQLIEFKKYLNTLSKDLAQKVILRKTRTTQGETYQQCTFQDVDEDLNEVLSEGEQKVISLSNFIAECTIGGLKNSIVFDDPVTSLDQNYKEKIAQIISNLAIDRQIIILTHDLNFLRLLIDEYNRITMNDYKLIGLKSFNGINGIVTDEIPYLAKNIQERIDSIRSIIKEIKGISATQIDKIEEKVEIACKRIRFLLEKSVEDILANKSIQRFSKNINVKAKQLSGYVVTEKSDIDFILKLFSKYSIPEHDGDVSAEYYKPTLDDIINDLDSYEKWKVDFINKQNAFIKSSGYK